MEKNTDSRKASRGSIARFWSHPAVFNISNPYWDHFLLEARVHPGKKKERQAPIRNSEQYNRRGKNHHDLDEAMNGEKLEPATRCWRCGAKSALTGRSFTFDMLLKSLHMGIGYETA